MKSSSTICEVEPIKDTQVSVIPPTIIALNKNANFQIDSGFCQYCGVDVFLFSHEFWCQLSS
ncbi:hypothetical protein INT48_004359 [Thamnidium elegans]|uniref:Uncharacterized protein n=1 Tax=Thamnidium elegans TaxID=101142 RepID=A0A8H7SL13_9FUNG|nr:hypothetical protein INT48_004359 [Thamnidium elegans]